MNVDELVRPKFVAGIAELRLQSPGAGGDIDLVIDGQKFSGGELGLVIAAVGIGAQCSVAHTLSDGVQLIFRKGKDDRDRLQLRDHQHRVCVGCVDDVSGINEAQAHATINRRDDVAVAELQLGVVNCRLVGAHCALKLVGGS